MLEQFCGIPQYRQKLRYMIEYVIARDEYHLHVVPFVFVERGKMSESAFSEDLALQGVKLRLNATDRDSFDLPYFANVNGVSTEFLLFRVAEVHKMVRVVTREQWPAVLEGFGGRFVFNEGEPGVTPGIAYVPSTELTQIEVQDYVLIPMSGGVVDVWGTLEDFQSAIAQFCDSLD